MWKILCFCLIFVKSVFSEYLATSVALGETPVVNKLPNLSGLEEYFTCFSIGDSNNKACAGYNYYIPKSGYYGYSTSSSDFSEYINNEVANDVGYFQALCPDKSSDSSKIAYKYSVYCGRMMYSQARWCSQNDENMRAHPELSLCKKTCIEYANSIVDYSQYYCGNKDNTLAEKIKDNIIKRWCNLFTDDEGCIEGVEKEKENCGYSSASLSVEAKTFNPSNSCWKAPDKIEALQSKAKDEANKVVKMGSIKWKIVYPLLVIVIVGIATYIFWRKQNELYKIGYVPSNDKKEEDYEYVSSNAKPSRDYVDEDFLTKEIEFPESTLTRNSSFAVSTLSRNRTENAQNSNNNAITSNNPNVMYMIAIYNYHAKMEDELELKAGDCIRVEHKYDDGWAAGINETTNKFGAFPLICCSDNISSNQGALPVRNRSSKLKNRQPNTVGNSPLRKTD